MKKLLLLILLVQILSFKFVNEQVIWIYDGDTIKVQMAGNEERIRLIDIDAPESNQFWGDSSTYKLIDLLKGKNVRIEGKKRDRYDRILATVYLEDLNVNEWMVSNGYAWVYKYSENEQLKALERQARSNKLGLWKYKAVDPYQWRKQH